MASDIHFKAIDSERMVQVLASDLLSHATELAKHAALPCQQRFHMCRQIILTCIERGQQCLEAKDKDAQSLLDHAYQLITEELVGPPMLVLDMPAHAEVIAMVTHDYRLHSRDLPPVRGCAQQHGPLRLSMLQELDEDDGDFEKFRREATSLQAQASAYISSPHAAF